MNNYQPKSKLAPELHSERVVGATDGVTQLNYGAWFVFKSPLVSRLGNIFENNDKYFYGLPFLTSSFALVVYFFKFIVAGNKNLSKMANLAMRATSFSCWLLFQLVPAFLAHRL